MKDGSVNTTLAVTKKAVIRSSPTERNPRCDNHQQSRQSTKDDLVMPDSDQHGFVTHHHLSIKNVPLHLSADEHSGPVMPAAVAHETEQTSQKPHPTWPPTHMDKNKQLELSHLFIRLILQILLHRITWSISRQAVIQYDL